MSGSLLKAPVAQHKPPHPEPRTESYGPTSTIGLKAHLREPVDFEAKAFASKLDNLAVSGDDPTRALTSMGFDGIGSDRVRIAGGTYQACEVMTSSDSLVCSAHKLVSRNPKQTNSQAIEQILHETAALKAQHPDREFNELHAMATDNLLPKKPAPKPQTPPLRNYSAPLASFDLETSTPLSSKRVGLKHDQAAPVVIDSKNLASKLTDLAESGDNTERALDELGFRGNGSDRVNIAGANFQSCEVIEASAELYISSHKLAGAFPGLDAKEIVNETLHTVAKLKNKQPDLTMQELTFDAVDELRKKQNPKTLAMI